jgi:tetratricopeptide (TPR) repeat protein
MSWTGLWAAVALCSACGKAAPDVKKPPGEFAQKTSRSGEQLQWIEKAQAAERAGDRARALRLYQQAEAQGYRPGPRAQLLLDTGQYEQVWREFERSTQPDLLVVSAEAARRLGRIEQAQAHLAAGLGWKEGSLTSLCAPGAPAGPSPATLRAGLLWGELALELGRRKAAEDAFIRLLECAQAPPETRAHPAATSAAAQLERWVYAGRAAALSRKYEIANDLFNQAEVQLDAKSDPRTHRDLLLFRAVLFLEKHDPGQAQAIGAELAQLWPHDPEVMLQLAQLRADTEFDFAQAEELAQQILAINPRHAGALFLLAGVELRDMNLKRARSYVERGLTTNARDLPLLSLRATLSFLGEDVSRFEAELEQLAQMSPGNVQPYLIFAEYAEWEHRYRPLEKYLRRAARLDRDEAQVRSRLGLTLVRAASDAAGVVELNRAYELDPYDVRVINTLNLYEKIIPRDYVSITRGPFRYRFPKAEAALLERYVPPLLEQAHREMVARYGYTPPAPIDIELYETTEQFAVRTSGVPSIGIQGVCFGHKLATVSPVGSPGNLGMTLWHELGHVFHIGLSDYRVPRYLTEGLAEWETARRNVGWSRELDRELYEVLRDGALPPLSQMSRAFTHARGGQDIAAAYYASGLLSGWLEERFGSARLVEVLRELGKGQLAQLVIPRVLGSSWTQLDQAFADHLTQKLRPVAVQFVPARARAAATELRPLLKKTPHDPTLQLELAVALLNEGSPAEAKQLADAAQPGALDQQWRFLRVRGAVLEDKPTEAKSQLDALLASGADGYSLRMLRARLLLAEKNEQAAVADLEAALGFDSSATDPRQLLVRYYQEHADPVRELTHLRAWAAVAEHDPGVHRRLVELLLEQDEPEEAIGAAGRLIWVDLANIETHRWAGLAFARGGRFQDAEFEWQSALLCPAEPDQVLRLKQTWQAELKRAGRGGGLVVERQVNQAIQRALAQRLAEPGPAPAHKRP